LVITSVARKGPDFAAFWEAIIAGLLLVGSATLVITNYKQVREINIFAFVLVVQSVPFLSAVALALIEGTRVNSFAFWRGLEAKIGELLPQRRAIGQGVISQVMASQVIAAEPVEVPVDNRVEAAQ
jgi:hypothetical protein